MSSFKNEYQYKRYHCRIYITKDEHLVDIEHTYVRLNPSVLSDEKRCETDSCMTTNEKMSQTS